MQHLAGALGQVAVFGPDSRPRERRRPSMRTALPSGGGNVRSSQEALARSIHTCIPAWSAATGSSPKGLHIFRLREASTSSDRGLLCLCVFVCYCVNFWTRGNRRKNNEGPGSPRNGSLGALAMGPHVYQCLMQANALLTVESRVSVGEQLGAGCYQFNEPLCALAFSVGY